VSEISAPEISDADPELGAELETAIAAVLDSEPEPGLAAAAPFTGEDKQPLPVRSPRLIALCGLPKSGKDVVAAYLSQRYESVRRLAYSTPMIAEVNAFLAQHPGGHVIDEANKSLPRYRRLLQSWALARRIERPDYWTAPLAKTLDQSLSECRLTVISGARLPSDLEPVLVRGGELWRVVRPHNPYSAEHRVEAQINELPEQLTLLNGVEGDLGQLLADVDAALDS
jgi:hypothetical protein